MTPPGSHVDATAELWFEGHQANSPPSPPQTLGAWVCPWVLATGRLWGQKELGPNSTGILMSFSLLGREDVVWCWLEPGGDLWGQPTLCEQASMGVGGTV